MTDPLRRSGPGSAAARPHGNALPGRRGAGAAALAAAIGLGCGPSVAEGEPPAGGPFAVTGFAGVLLDNDYQDVLVPTRLEIEDAYLAGVAGSVRLARPIDGLEIGLEAQLVRHAHAQTHWEVNAPVATLRWTAFPWDGVVDTGAAFGLGLSLADETPRLEARNEGDSRPVMAYWMVELSFALPGGERELIARLHHRSTAYGTFGEEGGANALVLGLRRNF